MENERMTGAELATMRQACGLSREELAQLCDVQPRTVKHWESGRAGVPADVAQTIGGISSGIRDSVRAACDVLARDRPAQLVLIRYRTDADMQRFRPDCVGMLAASTHGAIVARTIDAIGLLPALQGIRARVVWFDPADYERWRQDAGQADSKATRQAWAAGQVAAQAMPHKGDQPAG